YRDFISLLPQSVVFEILKTLTLQELSRSREVCKNWKSIVDREPDLWKPKDETKTAE
ncbi:unnamed protein product, partial [Rotaria socialis]